MDVTTNPALITAADGADTTLNFKGACLPNKDGYHIAYIEVIAGTFQFNVGASADNAACPTFTAGDKLILSFDGTANSEKDIHFHAANAAETFKISV